MAIYPEVIPVTPVLAGFDFYDIFGTMYKEGRGVLKLGCHYSLEV